MSSILFRVGISDDQKYGQCWKPVLKDADWDSLSVSSVVSSSDADVADGSNESLVSLKPDVPIPVSFEASGSIIPPNSFCWIDGACASSLRY